MANEKKKPVKIVETVLRDAHQSLIATRMTTEQMLPIIGKMDEVGYHAVECWGGATFDASLRFLKEDPWERLRKLRDGFKKTKLQMLFRGQNILGYNHYADDVVEYFVQKSVANGIDIIRIFDALNDPIMGSIVDRTRTPWGKCRPYLKWMAIPIGIMTLACFLPFYQAKSVASFAAISAIYVIWSVVYTVADVPYWGLSTCLTNNTEVRGKVLTVARLACTLGAGLVTVSVPIISSAVTQKYKQDGQVLVQYIGENANTLKWTYFLCALVLVVVSMPMFFYGFKN